MVCRPRALLPGRTRRHPDFRFPDRDAARLNYDSPNYQWFSRHYDDFGYIDRVAVDRSARRSGVASALYDDFRTFMSRDVDVLTCEVNLRPPNETSMRFHERQGFRVVARQKTEGGSKEVALMEKKL